MSYTAEELVKIAVNFEQLTAKALVILAKKKDEKSNSKAKGKKKMPPWLKGKDKKSDSNQAKDKKSDKKTKKSSEYYDGILAKFGQTTTNPDGTVTLPPFTRSENVMELGEGNVDEFGNPNPKPARPASRFQSVPAEVQEALAKLGYKGPKGEPVVGRNGKGDGQLGPITQSALTQYRDKNKDRAVDIHGQPVSQELMYEMIKRDASGENKTTAFDHKTTNDTLNAASAYLTQLQALQGQKQILPKNVEQIKQQLGQYANSVAPAMKAINDTLSDERSSQQEKQLAQQLAQKAKKLNDDIAAWNQFLNTIQKPMTDENPYGQQAPAQSNVPTPSTQT